MRGQSYSNKKNNSNKEDFQGGETKVMKKSLKMLLVFALVFSMLTPALAFAEEAEMDAQAKFDAMVEAGILEGIDGEAALDKNMQRNEVAKILANIFELEVVAGAPTPFPDEPADNWGYTQGYIQAVVAAGLMQGGEKADGTIGFRPNDQLSLQELAVVLNTVLDLPAGDEVEGKTSSWATAAVAAVVAAGLLPASDDFTVEATRGDLVNSTYEVYVAVEASKVPDEAAIESFTATGAKELTVEFNKAVDADEATFAVKKGSITVNVSKVEFDEAEEVATLTLVGKLTAGDYTVTVSGLADEDLTASVTAESETVTNVELLGDVAPLLPSGTNVTFNYTVENQYGEDITSTTTLTWTASQGVFDTNPATGTKQLNSSFVINNAFVVTAIHPTTGVSATKTYTVGAEAKVSEVTEVSLYHATDATLKTNSTFGDFFIKVMAVDQYGNNVTAAQLNSDVTVVISNPTVLDKVNFVTIPGTTDLGLQLAAPVSNVAGDATVTMFSNITAKSKSLVVSVEPLAALDELVLDVPADLVVKGEKVMIPFEAYDQHGMALSESDKASLSGTLLTSTDSAITFSFDYNYATKKAELTLDAKTNPAVTTGNKVIMAITSTGKVSQITVDVKATATPVAVVGTSDLVSALTAGATSSITPASINVVDQYGRTMTLNSDFFTNYRLDVTSATPANVFGSGSIIAATASSVTLTGVATGSSTVGVEVYKLTTGAVANSKYEFTAETVAKTAIASYTAETPETLYTASSHAKAVSVYGVKANGAKVALASTDYVVTTNDVYVAYTGGGTLDADLVTFASANASKDVTVLIVVDGATGPQQITKTVKVTNAAPVVTTLATATAGNVTVSGETAFVSVGNLNSAALKAVFSAKDQYSVAFPAFNAQITNVLYTNVDSSTMVVASNGAALPTITTLPTAGDTFTVTIITANGLTKSLNVVVTN